MVLMALRCSGVKVVVIRSMVEALFVKAKRLSAKTRRRVEKCSERDVVLKARRELADCVGKRGMKLGWWMRAFMLG